MPALFVMAVASTLIVVGSVGTLIFSVIMLGVSTESIFPVSVALISDEVSKNHLGTAMGYFETASAAGQMIAPLVGGFLAQTFEPTSPYILCAIISVSCALVVFNMAKHTNCFTR